MRRNHDFPPGACYPSKFRNDAHVVVATGELLQCVGAEDSIKSLGLERQMSQIAPYRKYVLGGRVVLEELQGRNRGVQRGDAPAPSSEMTGR